mmetsp:Transcript_36764/g.84648  ORF Transcript_36764/g.84648 Transcript_36764/m.84648 type:complete len:93 (-) Transcript_36764:51-329(-)
MSTRTFQGVNNKMPGPDAGAGGRGYVILGPPEKWTSSAPQSITILEQTIAVKKEDFDYMARGVNLKDGSHDAVVTLEDGSTETISVSVESVC